jgi:TonB family protein
MPRIPNPQTLAAALASIGVHVAVAVGSAVLMANRIAGAPEPVASASYPVPTADDVLVVELPQAALEPREAAPAAPPEPEPPPVLPPAALPPGGVAVAHVDTGSAGHGGDDDTRAKARALAPRVEEDTVTPWIRDDLDGEQENRLATGQERRGWVDRRRALQPMELTFVASGRGFRYERRAPAVRDATRGVPSPAKATPTGSQAGASGVYAGAGDGAARGGDRPGAETPSPAQGASFGARDRGDPQLDGARVALARPHVDRGNPSIASDDRGRSGDRRDADLAVSDARRSIVATSTAGGDRLGDGRGGAGGGGAAAAGGNVGTGSLGGAQGTYEGPEAQARRLRRSQYELTLFGRIGPLLSDAFPHDAYAQLRNGTLYLELTIAKDGRVVGIVVSRPSGVPGFDENVVGAIRGAGAFDPLPDLLGVAPLTFHVPVTGGWQLQ